MDSSFVWKSALDGKEIAKKLFSGTDDEADVNVFKCKDYTSGCEFGDYKL